MFAVAVAAAVAAAFVLSHSGQQTATVGLETGHALDAAVTPWFSHMLPLTVAADFSRPAVEVLVDIEAAVREALERGPFLRDVSVRMPVQVEGPLTSPDFNVAVVGDGVFGRVESFGRLREEHVLVHADAFRVTAS